MPTYSFKTSKGFRIDAVAKNPMEAFVIAQQNRHKMVLASAGMETCIANDHYFNSLNRFTDIYGVVLPEYITYKRGFADVNSWKSLIKDKSIKEQADSDRIDSEIDNQLKEEGYIK